MTAPATDKEYLEQPSPMPLQNIEPIDEVVCLVVGPNPAMQNVLRLVEKVAPNGVTILVTGESGTGKEVIARLIHKLSSRKNKPFCAINCGAIPQDLIESELFGYETGAFTGANRPRVGRLEAASGGTVFLDEIEVASPALQQKLLRVIESKEIEKLGGKKIKTDIRFIAASNQNLRKEVEEKRFREDLFYRFTFPINIPPLRNRAEDISNLAHFILVSKVRAIDENAPKNISIKAMDILEKGAWKGNIRELENVLIQAVLNRYTTGDILYSTDVIPFVERDEKIETPEPDSLAEMEKITIERALKKTLGNKEKASKLLEITRNTLYSKIKTYKITE